MAGSTQDDHRVNGEVAKATSPATTSRQDAKLQPTRLVDDDPDKPEDISNLLIGSQAITGKAAMQQAVRTHAEAAEKETKKRESEIERARQLANLAEWNKKKTTINGVEMTNDDAQKARRRFTADEDRLADEAVKRGYIKPDERKELKQAMRHKTEIQDRVGRGIATPQDLKDDKAIDDSGVGHAVRQSTTDLYHGGKGIAVNQDQQHVAKSEGLSSDRGSAARADDVFKGAPKLAAHFDEATHPSASSATPVPLPVARNLKATGLDV